MSNAKYSTALALRENYDDDALKSKSSMENYSPDDAPITYVVKVKIEYPEDLYSIETELKQIEGVKFVSTKYDKLTRIAVRGEHVDPSTIIQTIVKYVEIVSYKKKYRRENVAAGKSKKKVSQDKAKKSSSGIIYGVKVANMCCTARLARIGRKLEKIEGVNSVKIKYDKGKIEVFGDDHLDPTTIREKLAKYAEDHNIASRKKENDHYDTCVVKIDSTSCFAGHCCDKIKKKLLMEINGIKSITIDQRKGEISVCGDIADPTRIIKTISKVCRAHPKLLSYEKNSDPNCFEDATALALIEKKQKKNDCFDCPKTWLLRVNCTTCFQKIRKRLQKINGVNFIFSTSLHKGKWKVLVSGDINPVTIMDEILSKYEKTATLAPYKHSHCAPIESAGCTKDIVERAPPSTCCFLSLGCCNIAIEEA